MKIECEVQVQQATKVRITLEGDFEAILELLRKVNFNLLEARELKLE